MIPVILNPAITTSHAIAILLVVGMIQLVQILSEPEKP